MLLNKHNLAVSQFIAKEESRYTLTGILVCEDGTVATDGHRLVKVTLPKVEPKNFPVVDGFKIAGSTYEFLLSKDAIQKIEKAIPTKATIPALNHVAVGEKTEDATLSLAVTDLETAQVFKPRKMSGQFPNWKAVIPEGEPAFEITVDAAYLAQMAKAAAQFTDVRSNPVRMRVYKGHTPIVFETVRDETEQTFTGLLLPLAKGDMDIKLAHYNSDKKVAAPEQQTEEADAVAV